MASLGAFFGAAAAPIAKKVLQGLGIGMITYAGVDIVFSGIRDYVLNSWSGLSVDLVGLLALGGYLLPLVLLGAAYAAYSVFLSMDKRAHPEKYQKSAAREELATTGKPPIDSVVSGQVKRIVSLEDYKPAIPGRPETAPAFDEIRRVSAMPLISACVQSADRCACYSQQGSRLNEITLERCVEILKGGKLFNPYLTNYSAPQNVIGSQKSI